METVISTMTDSSESHRGSDVMEKYTELNFGQGRNGADAARLAWSPGLARSFGDVDALCVLSAPNTGISANQEHAENFLKLEPGPWQDITDKAFPLKDTTDLEISTTDACKFIKDEREPALISASPRAAFDITQNIDTLDVSSSARDPIPPPLLDSGAGVMVQLPQPGALVSLSQVKPEAAAALSFDSAAVCRTEMGGWDSHMWFSSAPHEERPGQVSFSHQEGIHSPDFIQRFPAVFSSFTR